MQEFFTSRVIFNYPLLHVCFCVQKIVSCEDSMTHMPLRTCTSLLQTIVKGILTISMPLLQIFTMFLCGLTTLAVRGEHMYHYIKGMSGIFNKGCYSKLGLCLCLWTRIPITSVTALPICNLTCVTNKMTSL